MLCDGLVRAVLSRKPYVQAKEAYVTAAKSLKQYAEDSKTADNLKLL